MIEFDPARLLQTLRRHGVSFVVIGGIAARLQGAPLLTEDVDITPDSDPANLRALAEALESMDAKLRTAAEPEGVPFPIQAELLVATQSWTLVTRFGDLDILFAPAGTAGFADLIRSATNMELSGDGSFTVMVASLADVIRSKQAAGREKDLAALPLLRRTLEALEGE